MKKSIFFAMALFLVGGKAAFSQSYCENFDETTISSSTDRAHAFNTYGNGNAGFLSEWKVTNGTPSVYNNSDVAGVTAYSGSQYALLAVCNAGAGGVGASEGIYLSKTFVPGVDYTVTMYLRNSNGQAQNFECRLLTSPITYTYNSGTGCSTNPSNPGGSLSVYTTTFSTTSWTQKTFTITGLSTTYTGMWIHLDVTAASPTLPTSVYLDNFCIEETACDLCLQDCASTNNVVKYAGGTDLQCTNIYDNSTGVGIGTSSPATSLHVNGQSVWLTGGNGGSLGSSAGTGMRMYYDATNDYGQIFAHSYSGGSIRNIVIGATGGNTGIGTSGNFIYSGVTFQVTGTTAAPSSGAMKLDVNGAVRALAYFATSDEHLKTKITPLENSLDKVMSLQGMKYYWNRERYPEKSMDNLPQIGFMAQEVAKVVPEAVIVGADGSYAVNYNMFIPLMVEAMKEQNEKINALSEKLAACACSEQGQQPNGVVSPTKDKAMLFQNTPNPFTKETEIKVYLPDNSGNATVVLNTLNGTQLQSFDVRGAGSSVIKINAGTLKAGMYTYSLIADGKVIDTKKLVLTEN